ncbi:succinate dehydrogenase assembly factor 3, mitochondrial isoform X1 [Hemitrygon akajei]|uniref:succinate dehydrogenase assembly factor 3, mitochondrial isoform X1 n=1 Tax=Hemitrygon akajei TaxID=2704970 RepID=UPI003BF9FD50
MAGAHTARVCALYKRLLRLHGRLPSDLRLLGDQYVKDEFRKNKVAGASEAARFLEEWQVGTAGSFEDPELELHSDFSSLREWDVLSGPHNRPLFDIPRTQPRRPTCLQGAGFSWLLRRTDSGLVPLPTTDASKENKEDQKQWACCLLCAQRHRARKDQRNRLLTL